MIISYHARISTVYVIIINYRGYLLDYDARISTAWVMCNNNCRDCLLIVEDYETKMGPHFI